MPREDQPTITDCFQKQTKYDKHGSRHKELTAAVTNLIAGCMLPFDLVDKKEFRNLLRKLDSRYEVPSRNHFSKVAIPQLYSEMKASLMAVFKDEQMKVSCTTDAWSSNTTEPYLSLTVHFINKDWELKTYCLRTIYMPESHTGENIANMLRDILREYGLQISSVVSFTTDSGSNMVKACKELAITRIPCFGHILHNAITNSLKKHDEVSALFSLCRQIVSTFSHSFKMKGELARIQKDLELPQQKLFGDVTTRWGSKFKMIERIYEQKLALSQLLLSDRRYQKLNPTWRDTALMETLIETLRPFHVLTDAMSAEKTVTISSLYPLLQHIKVLSGNGDSPESDMGQESDSSGAGSSIAKEIKDDIWSYVSERFSKDDTLLPLLKMCTMLDPRYKLVDNETKEKLVIHAVALDCEDEGSADSLRSQAATPSNTSANESNSLISLLTSASVPSTEVSQSDADADTRARREIDYYMQHSYAQSIDPEGSILDWWRTQASRFPMITEVARRYLACNATSVASERLFSLAGNVVNKKRSCLKPDMVDMLSCLAFNLKD